MDSEHIISEMARWRETFTLEQLMGMFIEGLGGQEAVAAKTTLPTAVKPPDCLSLPDAQKPLARRRARGFWR